MRRLARLRSLCLASAALVAPSAWGEEPAAGTFHVLCYHEVRDQLRERPDSYTVETAELVRQFSWLREQGYHVISLRQALDARRDHRPLPQPAVLLTFDDGFESIYTRVWPLLQAFHYPAVVGLVGSWLQEPTSGQPPADYAAEHMQRADFLSRAQISELQSSGLIEFASHTYAMHVGIPGNPQGNLEPAAVTRRFDTARDRYEGAEDYAERIRQDLTRSRRDIARLTGIAPRAVIWPYGAHNRTSDRIAREVGMPYGFTLELGANTPSIPLERMRRTLVGHDFTVADLARTLQDPLRYAPLRAMQVDLDFVYDANPAQQEANLSQLLDRVQAMGVNAVFLQAFADPTGTGTAEALYFPNRRMPMRADLFNRTAWQLRTRTGVAVYAWLPLLAFALPASDPAHEHWVLAKGNVPDGVRRLSPFDPLVRQAVSEIYEDLSTFAAFEGVLFSDDASLSDFEDAGDAARAAYRAWGLPADIATIRADPVLANRWSEQKIRYLTQFSLEVAEPLKADHDGLWTARNLFAGAADASPASQWLGQSLTDALGAYDYVALMAMPYLEGARSAPDRWLAQLVRTVDREPAGIAKTVFELQSVDWARHGTPIDPHILAAQLVVLRRAGARNLAYYPDDFRNGRPSLDVMRPALSDKSFPGSD